jgi:hypothetical protein
MAYQLAALVPCEDMARCALCKQLLDRGTRPLFAEDLSDEHLSLFEVIEEIDYPEESEILPEGLWLFWYRSEAFGFAELLRLLAQFGLQARFVFEVPDAPMSGDTDEDEASGICWIGEGGEYVRVDREDLGKLLPPELIERLPG